MVKGSVVGGHRGSIPSQNPLSFGVSLNESGTNAGKSLGRPPVWKARRNRTYLRQA